VLPFEHPAQPALRAENLRLDAVAGHVPEPPKEDLQQRLESESWFGLHGNRDVRVIHGC